MVNPLQCEEVAFVLIPTVYQLSVIYISIAMFFKVAYLTQKTKMG
jgi:hypothetical protein